VTTRRAETIGSRIRRLREERGFSRCQSGRAWALLHLSQPHRGRAARPIGEDVAKLAAKLDVAPLYLELGTDDATCPHCGRAPKSGATEAARSGFSEETGLAGMNPGPASEWSRLGRCGDEGNRLGFGLRRATS
jgi:transcriptional regulator with XRE-family HTH domain